MTCDTGQWISEGVSSPPLASLEDLILYWLLLGPFPEFSVADGVRPSDPKDSSMAGVDEHAYINRYIHRCIHRYIHSYIDRQIDR